MINARAEGINEKPSFRTPFRKRRCLVPADGFYEWKKIDAKTTICYYFRLKSHEPFVFVGVWDLWEKGPAPFLQHYNYHHHKQQRADDPHP